MDFHFLNSSMYLCYKIHEINNRVSGIFHTLEFSRFSFTKERNVNIEVLCESCEYINTEEKRIFNERFNVNSL